MLPRETGVSAMAPYRHFADKEALLSDVAAAGFAALAAALDVADQADKPKAALIEQGTAYFHFAQSRPALFRLIFGGGAACSMGAMQNEAFAVLLRRVTGIVDGDPRIAALAAWSAVHGLATRRWTKTFRWTMLRQEQCWNWLPRGSRQTPPMPVFPLAVQDDTLASRACARGMKPDMTAVPIWPTDAEGLYLMDMQGRIGMQGGSFDPRSMLV